MLRDYSILTEDLLYRLTDTARRIGELKAQIHSSAKGSGSPASPIDDYVSVLIVKKTAGCRSRFRRLCRARFSLTTVVSGGAALDRVSERPFDLALIKETLPDLPSRTVIRSLQAQSPETLVMLYLPPTRGKARTDRSAGSRWRQSDDAGERVYIAQTAGRTALRASASAGGTPTRASLLAEFRQETTSFCGACPSCANATARSTAHRDEASRPAS